jgi:Dolichyl-phosphate-mannose-protein mannosyltransferase
MPAATAFRAETALLLAALALGIYGIDRSLWTDEAWVANSVLAPSLSGMFYYPDWLQTTPPLFLFLTRAAVQLFGASNVSFRLVPLAFALLGVAAMMEVSRRLLAPPFAALACVLLVFHPTTIEYSRTCKQYSAELAASAVILLAAELYLRQPGRRRFLWIVGAFVLMLPAAWSTAFLLPGVAIAVWAKGGISRAVSLVLVVSAVLAALYMVFIRPNLSPELRLYWIASAQHLTPGLLAAVAFCVAAAARALFLLTKQPDSRALMQLVAVLPCLLLTAADLLHLYPAEPRTRLFALPCFLLVAAMNAEDLALWGIASALPPSFRSAPLTTKALYLAVIAVGAGSVWSQIRQHQNRPQEDLAGAVQLLRQHVGPADLLLVHPSVFEGFKLYAKMEGWRDSPAIYGDTGWPCCARNKLTTPGSSNARAVSEDIDRMVPRGFSGRVWLYYSARHTHWAYIGNDEGVLWRNHLWDRGCPPTGPYLQLQNIAISAMDCVQAR